MEQHDWHTVARLLGRQPDAGMLNRSLRHGGFLNDRGRQCSGYHQLQMDVTDSTFQSAVIERSHTLPVVVDFWAEWCGPCRQLGPVIERAVAQRAGKLELAKLDVDSNQIVARTYRVQSIPAVKAFRDGKVVAEFIGAQPPMAVERFLDALLPSEAD